jgi:hypothetical protein
MAMETKRHLLDYKGGTSERVIRRDRLKSKPQRLGENAG